MTKLNEVAPLQPDLELDMATDLEEVEALWHKGHTDLYTMPTIIKFLKDHGMVGAVPYLALGAMKHDMEQVEHKKAREEVN